MYTKIAKFTDIKVSDFTATGKSDGCHILVCTIGKLKDALTGRRPIDISELRVLVIDEADIFFSE